MAPDNSLKPVSTAYTDLPMKVYYTDGTVYREACITIVPVLDLEKDQLADLRDDIGLASDKKESSLLGFCSKGSANIPDSFTVKEYLANGLGVDVSKRITELTIYLKKDGLISNDPVQPSESSSLGRYIDANKLAWLKQSFDENAFKLLTGTAAKYVAELEEQEWSVIAENNALCFGSRIIHEDKDGTKVAVGIERAPYPAFRLKRRRILSDTLTSTSVKDIEMELRIPDFRMDDQSYVSTFVLENKMQAAMAESSYSQTDIAAAVSGSLWGCSASVGGELGLSSSSKSSSSSESSSKQVMIAYNFPRVTIFLDPENLELTSEAQARLTDAMAQNDSSLMNKFLDDYGEVFSARVQLGGRLFASEHIESGSHGEVVDTAKSMKASAATTFSGWGGNVSASASHEEKSSKSSSKSSARSSMALTWQATGGDTLLCNDPAAWSASVAYHWNWRITKKDKVIPMVSKLANFHGFGGLPKKIGDWDSTRTRDAAAEARRAKEKKEREIKEAVNAKLKDISDSYQRFYLPEDSYESKVLTMHYASEESLDTVAQVWNKAEGKTTIKRTEKLKGRGVCRLTNEPLTKTHEFQAETKDGKPVQQVNEVRYGEKYRIINRSKRLYIDYHWASNERLVFANTAKGSLIEFKDHDGKETAGPIPAKAKVDLVFYYPDNSSKDKGQLYYTYCSGYTVYLKLSSSNCLPVMFKPVK